MPTEIFSGSHHLELTKSVVNSLNFNMAQAEIIRFENSEVRVRILEDVRDKTCVVIQPTSNPTDTNLIELLQFSDALRRGEAKKIVGVIPYFGYARQNKQHRTGEAVSAHIVVKTLESVGFDEIMAFDIHDEGTEGVFSVPFRNLTALPLLAKKIRDDVDHVDQIAVVSPDQGGVERARTFANAFYEKSDQEIVIIEKKRDLEKIHKSEALEIFGDVEGKIAIIVDDIVTSGGTLIHAVDLCIEKGAKAVYAAIVHHDLSKKAPKKLQESKIAKFYTTNTIPLQEDQKFGKMIEISVAPLIANELKSLE